MNRVELVGRLTQKPEIRYTNSNLAFTRFTVAVNRQFSNAQGERQADFIQCVAWRKQAENVCNYLDKGSLVAVEGRIQTGSYDDKDGNRRYTTEVQADSVQFLESRSQSQNRPQMDYNNAPAPQPQVSPYDYQNNANTSSNNNNTSVNFDNDPFADFGDSVSLDDADLD